MAKSKTKKKLQARDTFRAATLRLLNNIDNAVTALRKESAIAGNAVGQLSDALKLESSAQPFKQLLIGVPFLNSNGEACVKADGENYFTIDEGPSHLIEADPDADDLCEVFGTAGCYFVIAPVSREDVSVFGPFWTEEFARQFAKKNSDNNVQYSIVKPICHNL